MECVRTAAAPRRRILTESALSGPRSEHRGFLDRKVGKRGGRGEDRVDVPHPIVASRRDEGEPAKPGAEERADLVRQQRQAEECGEKARAEQLADDGRRGGDRREPSEPEAGGE